MTGEIEWYCKKKCWSGLAGLGMVHSGAEQKGKITGNSRHFITSLTDIEIFSQAVRAHWEIENAPHRCLGMTFREDYSRIRKDHSAENMVVVRHLALNILKSYSAKLTLARKRRRRSFVLFSCVTDIWIKPVCCILVPMV